MRQKDAAEVLRDANDKLVLAALRLEEQAEVSAKEEAIFNALPDVVARFDRLRRLVYVNTSAERITGRSRAELLGRTKEELGVSPVMAAEWDMFLADAFRRDASAETFFTFEGPVQRTFHVRAVPESDDEGAIGSVVAIARDVTDSELYRRARADADRLRRLQAITAAFSEAPTPRDIAQVLAPRPTRRCRSDAAVVMLLDEAGRNSSSPPRSAIRRPSSMAGALFLSTRQPPYRKLSARRRRSFLRRTSRSPAVTRRSPRLATIATRRWPRSR